MRNVVNNRKKLKGKDLKAQGVVGKLFINESMTPEYRSSDWKCRQLKKAGLITQCWFYNGGYTIEHKGERKKIFHYTDLEAHLSLSEEEIKVLCQTWKDVKGNVVAKENLPV